MWFEIYESGIADFDRREYHEQWYWRLRSHNGRIVAEGSKGYTSKANVKRALRKIILAFETTTSLEIREVDQ